MRRLFPEPADLGDADDAALAEAYRLPERRSVRVNFVASLDGAVTVGGRSEGLGSPGDKRIFRVLRALADVVLVGHGTAAAENYRPVLPDSTVGRLRAALGRPPAMPVAVVSRRASLDPASRLVAAARTPTVLVTCDTADRGRRSRLVDAGVDVLVCGGDDVDLPAALVALADRGLGQVVCEGGPQLLRAMLTAGLVQELDLSIAPALVGGEARLLDAALGTPARLALQHLLEEDGTLFGRYGVRPPGGRAAGGQVAGAR